MTRLSKRGNQAPLQSYQKSVIDGLLGFKDRSAPQNPQFDYSGLRNNASLIFERYSLTQNGMYYKFKGFPEYDQSWKKCRMLYYRGSLATVEHNDYLYTLPFTFDGTLDEQGFPTSIRVVPYAPGQALQAELLNKSFTPRVDCAILMDHIPFGPNYNIMPRNIDNTILNNMKAEALTRVQMSMVAHFHKHIVTTADAQIAEKVEKKLIDVFNSDTPVGVVSDLLTMNKEIFEGMEYTGDQYFRTMKDIQALQDLVNGISTSGYGVDKNERLVAGELMGIQEQIDISANVRYELAKMYCEDCNRIWGLQTDVELQHMFKEDLIDLQAKTMGNAMGGSGGVYTAPKTQNTGGEPSVDK